MKILVMRTCGDENGICPNAEIALVELTKEVVDGLKKSLALAKLVKAVDESFFSMDLRDWNPIFISTNSLEKLKLKLTEGWEDAGHTVTSSKEADLDTLIAQMSLDGKGETERMDSSGLTVADDSFWWTVNPKHTSLSITTMNIYEKDFETIAKELE